jgi:hypothetical protein
MGEFLKIQILETKTKVPREFTITPGNVSGLNLLEVFRRYSSLRSKNTRHQRFFVGYRLGKCIAHPVGINTIGGAPKQIATFLGLKNPEEYTGHAFRRSSATLLAESGADTSILKRLGGWKSTNVAEGYVDESIQNKKKIAQMILGKDNTTSKGLSFKKLKTHDATSSSGQIPEKNNYLSVDSYHEMSAVSSNNQISDELNLSSSLTEGFHISHLHNCTVNIYRMFQKISGQVGPAKQKH